MLYTVTLLLSLFGGTCEYMSENENVVYERETIITPTEQQMGVIRKLLGEELFSKIQVVGIEKKTGGIVYSDPSASVTSTKFWYIEVYQTDNGTLAQENPVPCDLR